MGGEDKAQEKVYSHLKIHANGVQSNNILFATRSKSALEIFWFWETFLFKSKIKVKHIIIWSLKCALFEILYLRIKF